MFTYTARGNSVETAGSLSGCECSASENSEKWLHCDQLRFREEMQVEKKLLVFVVDEAAASAKNR